MKLAVFACDDYYPNGGAADFIGFAPTGSAVEIVELLRQYALRSTCLLDTFNLLDCESGKITGAWCSVNSDRIVISLHRASSASSDVTLDRLDPELLDAFKKLSDVEVLPDLNPHSS
jgi:hypothetical protein